MKVLYTPVALPKPLWKIHGKKPLVMDLLFTYLFAILVSFINFITFQSDSIVKMAILIILSFDIAGGVISNFSKSTRTFYRKHPKSRAAFIWTHFIHTFAFLWLFPDQRMKIVSLTVFIIFSSYLVLKTRNQNLQKTLSICFFCCVMVVTINWLNFVESLSILLILFSFKLTMGFAARWN